jgi:hypothetical protein
VPLGLVNQEIGDVRRDPAVEFPIEHDCGRQGAIPEAVHRFHGETAIFRGPAQFDSQAILDVPDHILAAHGLTGLGSAHFQDMPARLIVAKVVVETHDAVHFGMG